HNKFGTRVLGYDNAHAVKRPKKFKFAGRRLAYDHRHRTASDKAYRTNSNQPSACWRTFSRKWTALSKRHRNEANCYWRDATEANPGTDDRHCQRQVQAQSWRAEDLVHFHEVGGGSSERPEPCFVEGDTRDKSRLGCGVGQDY